MHVLLVSIVDDPLDTPGFGRIGGGHLFVFDLGRYLIRRGHSVTYIVRSNDDRKALDESLGERCRILRIRVGPPHDVEPSLLAPLLGELGDSACRILSQVGTIDTIHSHYWIGGYVGRQICAQRPAHHVHSILSLGRLKTSNSQRTSTDLTRDQVEIDVFNACDRLIAACPNELTNLTRLYPEVRPHHVNVIPYGVDTDVFFPRPERSDHLIRRTARRLAQGASDVS